VFVLAGDFAPGGEAAASPSSRLVYVRSPDALACGDESVLRAAVVHRFGYDPFFSWARRTVVVQLSRADKRYRAQVQIVDEDGVAHGVREITSDGESCDELLDATALAVSIALDASGPDAPAPQASGSTTPPTASSSPPVAAPTLVPSNGAGIPPPPEPTGRARASTRSTFVGADVLASVGTAPSPTAGLSLFGGVRSRIWSAALEMRADAPAGAQAPSGGGSVSAWLLLGGMASCLHVGWTSFCVVGQLGTLQAQGAGVDEPRDGSAFLALVGLRAGAQIALSDLLALHARLEGLVDLHPPTLNLGPTTVWPAPFLASTVGVGLVVRIP
jgi:hypothetical protein